MCELALASVSGVSLLFILVGKEVVELGNVGSQHRILFQQLIALAFQFGNQLVHRRLIASESVFEKLNFVRNRRHIV
jgi:hypothetical protein